MIRAWPAVKGSKCEMQRDKVGGNAWEFPDPAISAICHSRRQRALFFHGNARSQAGKIGLSMGTQLVNLNLVKIAASLEIQGLLHN